MDSSELNRLSGVSVASSLLNTDLPQANSTSFMLSSSSPNAAPVLRDTIVGLNEVTEDAPAPVGSVGTLISSIVDLNRNVTDTDSVIGIAITKVGTANSGNWYYSTDAGKQWSQLADVSESNARLLTADGNTRIYFQPIADYNGFISNAITFRAWDTTNGSINGSVGNASSNGGITAFSADIDTASLQVRAVNDAPVNIIPSTTSTTPISLKEDNEIRFVGVNAIKVSDVDAGDVAMDVTLIASSGTLQIADSTIITPGRTLSLTGSVTTINTALDKLIYKPIKDDNGAVDIRIITNDRGNTGGVAKSDEDTIYFNFEPANDPPSFTKGFNDTVDEDFPLRTISWATNILKGGSDEFNQTLTFNVATSSEEQKLFEVVPTIDANGVLRYKPKANVFGTANVSVILEDNLGAKSEAATFSITINSVNDRPDNLIPSETPQTVLEDSVLTFSNARRNLISINDIDAGTGTMQVKLEAPNGTLKISPNTDLNIRNNDTGTITLTGTQDKINAALDGLQFKPNTDFNGNTSINITTNDQNNSGKGIAYEVSSRIDINVIPVNDAPRFTKGNNQLVKEDTPSQNLLWATDISTGTFNETNQFFKFTVKNDNNSLFAVQPEISPNGFLSYSLAPNVNGVANVTVVLEDSGDNSDAGKGISTPETFTITVTPVNDAPVNKIPSNQVILEDDQFVFSGDNAISISDIDAGNNPVQVKLTSTNGTLTWNDSKVLSTARGKGTDSIILTGTVANINTDLNGLIFKANTNFNGQAFIKVVTNDQGSTGDDSAWEVTSYISIQVNPVNDAPTFTKGSDITVKEDAGLLEINGWATRISTGASDELQVLAFIIKNSNNALFAEQPRIFTNGSLGTLVFRTAENANGTAKVTISLRDYNGTDNNGRDTSTEQEFIINVDAVNDAPVNRIPTSQTIDEDNSLVFSAFKSISNAITVSDIDTESGTLQTTISTESGILSLQNPSVITNVNGNNTRSITLVGTANTINNALEGLTFKPTANFYGTAKIIVTTNDQGNTGGGALTDTATITVIVNPINDAPSFTPGANVTVFEDSEKYSKIWATNLSKGLQDDNAQKLSFVVSNTNNALFSEQPTILPDGTLTFKSAANANGEATVSVQLRDDGGTDKNGKDSSQVSNFKIIINPVVDAPVNNIPTTIPTIDEDGLVLAVFSINTGNPITITDVDGEPNAVISVALSSENGTLALDNASVVNAKGNNSSNISFSGTLSNINRALNGLTFKPNLNFNGEAKITIISDKQGQKDTDIIKVNVNPINDAPTVKPGNNLTVSAGALSTFTNWATLIPGPSNESEQKALEYFVSSISDSRLFAGTPFIDPQGNLTFTTATGIKTPTTATIGIKVRDDGGGSNGGVNLSEEKTFTITINPIQANIAAASEFVDEGYFGTTEYNFIVSLSGASNETVTVKYSTANGTATVTDKDYQEKSGTLTFTPGETTKTVKILVNGDTKFEADQTFQVNLAEPTNVRLGTVNAVAKIRNDDTKPVISIGDASAKENSSTSSLNFTVGLSNPSDEAISVDFALMDGTATIANGDYTPGANTTVKFAPGETSQTITIKVNADSTLEASETLFAELKNPVNGTISTKAQKATGTIVNDEATNTTDINGDGYSDIVLRNYQTGENVVWFMDKFVVKTSVFINRQQDTSWVLEGIADFTGEGKTDFLYRNYRTGENEIWMMDGATRLQVLPLITISDTNWEIKGVSDFNSDLRPDIMWYNSETGESMIWQMYNGVITKSISLPKVNTTDWNVELTADLSGDGKTDILWRNENTGENTVWVMDDTSPNKVVTIEPEVNKDMKIQGVGDFNNDGKLDIVWSNYITGENFVWLLDNTANNITVTKKEMLPKSEDTNWRMEQITDFDFDGNLDLLFRNYSSGENEIWRMKGTSHDQIIKLTTLNERFWEI
jgi:Calx-beta domain/Bacterial Ig domain/FG-GAP-like repeat/Bacterial cadherin-like domain